MPPVMCTPQDCPEIALDLLVQLDGVLLELRDIRVAVHRVHAARGVPGRAGGQFRPLDQEHVLPAGLGQVIQDAGADHAAADHHHSRVTLHRISGSHDGLQLFVGNRQVQIGERPRPPTLPKRSISQERNSAIAVSLKTFRMRDQIIAIAVVEDVVEGLDQAAGADVVAEQVVVDQRDRPRRSTRTARRAAPCRTPVRARRSARAGPPGARIASTDDAAADPRGARESARSPR